MPRFLFAILLFIPLTSCQPEQPVSVHDGVDAFVSASVFLSDTARDATRITSPIKIQHEPGVWTIEFPRVP